MAFDTHPLCVCKVNLLFIFALFAAVECLSKGFRSHARDDGSREAVFEEHWFTQKLDHFSGAESSVWKQVGSVHFSGGSEVLKLASEEVLSIYRDTS